MNYSAHGTILVHKLQRWASDMLNTTTSVLSSILNDGSKLAKATKDETTTWTRDKAEVVKVSIQRGWQNVIGHTETLWWWSKFGFAAGTFFLTIFVTIYLYLNIGRLCFCIRRRRHR